MRISREQLKKVAESASDVTPESALVDEAVIRLTDRDLIQEITHKVMDMPDREEMIAELKARIESGDYDVSGDDVADAMIRRAIADQVR
ncbi:MAG: flagellar biosynthesis anti-sigma factor FlgM [Armatimonadetes bacterium]|nr:flagellar biosynthesis anti-sigma factor FlgM [Armatimonadota bacterium]